MGSLIAANLLVTSLTDTTASDGTTYYYVMTSVMSGAESAESIEVSATPGTTGVIKGSVRYEDKEYGAGGFTGVKSWKAVRYVDVDVIQNGTGVVLSSRLTDSRGNFSFSTAPSSTQVYVRVNSTATPTASGSIAIMNLSSNLYGVPSDPFPLSGSASVGISVSAVNSAGGAFNILDVMTTGYEFVKAHDGAYPSASLNTYWAPGNFNGTFYCYGLGCPAGDGIYVLSWTGVDTDEYDDDVLWHEFGHYIASTFSVDQSPGGYHSLSDNDHDLRFSWSEGWGDFMPGAVKSWLAETDPARLSTPAGLSKTMYVDTSASGGFSFDFGSNSSIYYAGSEVAVARVLLRLRELFSMQDIWDIVTSFLTPPPVTPVNLEFFWDRWMASKPTSTGGITVESIFEERQILYRDDPYEQQDDSLATAATITVNILQSNRTIYADGDWDHVKFTPNSNTPYTIRTTSLRNGADTYLELFDNFGVLLRSNDNTGNATYTTPPEFNCVYDPYVGAEICHENGNDLLGSTLTFLTSSVAPTGPYTVRVRSSSAKPDSAGRYGTYNLIVSSP